jgi:magnesium transporter
MQRSVYRSSSKELRTGLTTEDIAGVLAAGDGCLWIDIAGETAKSIGPLFRDTFGFHPLAIDDALQESHVPKLDDWGEYTYLNLHGVRLEEGPEIELATQEVDLFVGRSYLISHRHGQIDAVDRVWTMVGRDERTLSRGPAALLYSLADEMVADVMPVIQGMDDRIDAVEDDIFERPTPVLIETIFDLKRALLDLRRILGPQREVLARLSRGDASVIPEGERIYFRDVYDHLVRQYDLVEGLRDLVTGALDTYLSVVSNRLNDVMKTLTVITTLFMPLSFLTGFFGMNFFQARASAPPWTSMGVFVAVIVTMLVVPIGMTWWMRRREWV